MIHMYFEIQSSHQNMGDFDAMLSGEFDYEY